MAQKRVGLIGYPIKKSLSPVMHNAAFKALGMDDEWLYDAMEIPPDIVRYAVLEPKRHGYIGLNVTIPFKETALEFVIPDDKARAIGAANTIDFRTDIATNTDVDGLLGDLEAHDVPIAGEKVIVLGAGGAARAAVYGLRLQGAEVVVVNRTMQRAYDMLFQLTASSGIRDVKVMTLHEASEIGASLIINCTSAGMYFDAGSSAWSDDVLIPENITAYDMVYNPAKTKFMQDVEAVGGRAIGGLGMLVRQGAAAFKIWTGVEPPLDVMFNAAKEALIQNNRELNT